MAALCIGKRLQFCCVALVDVGITEWRVEEPTTEEGIEKLHSLMLALPNGGSEASSSSTSLSRLHSLMLALPNGGRSHSTNGS